MGHALGGGIGKLVWLAHDKTVKGETGIKRGAWQCGTGRRFNFGRRARRWFWHRFVGCHLHSKMDTRHIAFDVAQAGQNIIGKIALCPSRNKAGTRLSPHAL